MRFVRSLRAEFLKILATKTWLILAIVMAFYSAMMAGVFAAMFGVMIDPPQEEIPGLTLEGQAVTNMVYSSVASFSYVIPLLLGTLMATGELRHKTIGQTFLAEPRRGTVFSTKMTVLFVTGILLAVLGTAAAVATAIPIFNYFGIEPNLTTKTTLFLILRMVTVLGAWAIIGFGIGLIVKNQAVAIVIALVFTQFLEPTLRMLSTLWDWSASLGRFFPGSATDAFVGASVLNDLSTIDPTAPAGAEMLTTLQGGLVIAGLAGLVVLIGWFVRWRKDVE